MTEWNKWEHRWDRALVKLSHGEEPGWIQTAPPAAEPEIAEVEEQLGISLPPSFRRTLLSYAAAVQFRWYLPDELRFPGDLDDICFGECTWNLGDLPGIEESRLGWAEDVFDDPEDPYALVWHRSLAFHQMANGDFLAFDLTAGPDYPVIYLSHDGAEIHGWRLGDSFIDFIDRWTQLACPGPESWQIEFFLTSPTRGIDLSTENARLWREWVGLIEG